MSFLKNKIQNITIQKRLIAFVSILMLLVVTMLFLSIRTVVLTKRQTTYIKKEQIEKTDMLFKISEQINELALYNHILIEKNTSIVELQSVNFHKIEEINELLDKYQEDIRTINQTIYFENFRIQFQNYQNVMQEVFNFIKNNKDESVSIVLTNKEVASYELLKEKLKEIDRYNQIEFSEKQEKLNRNFNSHVLISIIITIISLLLILFIIIMSVIDVKSSYYKIKKQLKKLGEGEVFEKNMEIYKSELGQLGLHINNISDNIKRIEEFTNHIEQDDYSYELEVRGEHDFTGQSLLKLK